MSNDRLDISGLEKNLEGINIYDDAELVQRRALKAIHEAKDNLTLEEPPLAKCIRDEPESSHSDEDELRLARPYLKYLQYEIGPDHYLPILLIIYHLSERMVKVSEEISKFLDEENARVKYLSNMSQRAGIINKEARRLFSDGGKVVTDAELEIEVEVNLLLKPFRESKMLSQSVILQLLLVLLKEGCYSSITRSFFNRLRELFGLSYRDFSFLLERPVSRDLIISAKDNESKGIDALKELKERSSKSRFNRWAWTSLGAVGGGVALAVSGGLAAPLILPYMGSILGASTLLAGASGVTLVTSIFGATGAGLAGYRFSRRVGSVKDFAFLPIKASQTSTDMKPLHVTVCISGWITSKEDIVKPWSSLEDGDVFALQFEAETLLTIGQALTYLFAAQVVGYAASEVLKKTVMAGLVAAAAWPLTLLQVGSIIDNPWSIGLDRADKAGLILADALINRAQGNRPVTLIGFSLGGRAIFSCLRELLSRAATDASAFHLIENVVILGAPITTSRKSWLGLKSLVSGRLINGFISDDWILSFLHRTYNYGRPVAGNTNLHMLWADEVSPSDSSPRSKPTSFPNSHLVPGFEVQDEVSSGEEFDSTGACELGIESVDLSDLVDGHLDYLHSLPTVLSYLGFATISDQDSPKQLPSVLYELDLSD